MKPMQIINLSVVFFVLFLLTMKVHAKELEQTTAIVDQIKVFSVEKGDYLMSARIDKSEEEWRQLLSPEQFKVLRRQGTEAAFSGAYWNHHEHGVYRCAGCGLDLYRSDDKFESGTGWPSFTRPVAAENIATRIDRSFFSVRTELLCSRCGGHLGHVFDDGPPPTGQRHCLNSAALSFAKLVQ